MYATAPSRPSPPNQRQVLFVGSLTPEKKKPDQKGELAPGIKGELTPEEKDEFTLEQAEADAAFQRDQRCFQAACYALGHAFAMHGYGVVTANADWDQFYSGESVTNYVLKGAVDSKLEVESDSRKGVRAAPVRFLYPQVVVESKTRGAVRPELGFFDFDELHDNGVQLQPVRTHGNRFTIVPHISEVDALVLIGGGVGTSVVGSAAYAFRKPVVALTCFGRAAQELADTLFIDQYQDLFQDYRSLDQACVQTHWEDNESKNAFKAGQVVAFTSNLIGAHLDRDQAQKSRINTLLVALIVGLLAWVLAYIVTINVPCISPMAAGSAIPPICSVTTGLMFYGLMFIAALLGTGARTLAEYQKPEVSHTALRSVWVDAVIALLITFGLSIVYLVGGLSYSAKIATLTPDPETFTTIAVSMSGLGLAAGFLLPLDSLKERLEGILNMGK